MKRLRQERVYLPDRTLSTLWDGDQPLSKILELPNRNNQRSISCIPEGIYYVTKEQPIPADDPTTEEDESGGRRERPYVHFRYHNVPGRRGILIHPGTDVDDSLGCQLPGSRFIGTDKPTLEGSKKKLAWLVQYLPDEFEVEIVRKGAEAINTNENANTNAIT